MQQSAPEVDISDISCWPNSFEPMNTYAYLWSCPSCQPSTSWNMDNQMAPSSAHRQGHSQRLLQPSVEWDRNSRNRIYHNYLEPNAARYYLTDESNTMHSASTGSHGMPLACVDAAPVSSQARTDNPHDCVYHGQPIQVGEAKSQSTPIADQGMDERNDHRIHESPGYNHKPYKCCWERCTNRNGLSKEAVLIWHIKSTHISPGKYKCSHRNCRKEFGRKDKLGAHTKLVHL